MPSIRDVSPQTGVGSLFIREFMDRELVEFDQCSRYYEAMTPEQLCQEMAFLMQPSLRAIPFAFSGKRYYALCDSMIQCAAGWRHMTTSYRSKMMNLCMDLLEYNFQRTSPESRDALVDAAIISLKHIREFSLFPEVANIIVEGKRDYGLPLEEGPVGLILERKR